MTLLKVKGFRSSARKVIWFVTRLQPSEYFGGKKDEFEMLFGWQSFFRQEGNCY